jgi:peroxiredoxin Q/BCP
VIYNCALLVGVLPGRVTYVIGKDGKVKLIFDDLIKAAVHPEKALQTILEVNSFVATSSSSN